MLFEPEAHEALTDEAWSAERMRAAISSIVADAEGAFDDGWPLHPQDEEPGGDARARFRTVYLGGAGVVAALHRLAGRDFVELRRDYVPYLERSLEARPDFPDEGAERSLWMGETGMRLVLQRLAPSQENLHRLSELIAANERDERCELMWGSPGTILAGRELGLDVTASIEWLRGRRDTDGLWTQQLYGKSMRYLGPAHGFAGCVLALPDAAGVSETLERHAVEEEGLVNWPPLPGMPLEANGDGQIRTQWCHGAPGIVATLVHVLDEELRRGWRVDVACRAAAEGRKPLPRHGRERLRIPGAPRTHRRRTVADASACVRDARCSSGGAQLVGSWARPLHPLDRRPRHSPLPRGLHRRQRRAAAPIGRPGTCAIGHNGEHHNRQQRRLVMRIRRFLVVGFVLAVLAWAPGATASPPLPSSIGGIGDSITRATDVCCWYGDHPAQSWSTGGGLFDGIRSHYERLLALTPAIYRHNYSDARAGAKMRDAEGQAQAAVAQRAAYVMILMGANDVCTSSPSTMTSVSDFRAQFTVAMDTLAAGLPAGSHVFVSSIPNVYQLWQLLHGNSTARFVWWAAQICQSMLSPFNTEQVRQFVLGRELAFNQVLGEVCSRYTLCRFDGGAVFNYEFSANQVSTLDYFHPSLSGQSTLAGLTWQRSWWAS